MKKLSEQDIKKFRNIVWGYYQEFGRHDMPWRKTKNPYRILISEIMLQQTQVSRVERYYKNFLRAFPTAEALAKAPLKEVLLIWQGMGYNRRALYLHQAAQKITKEYHGTFPKTIEELVLLPSIGKNTAGAILAYAYNLPVVYIETNIRRIFIHHFFAGKTNITDKEILPLVEQTLPPEKAREWYWALMDYGSTLIATSGLPRGGNPNKRSKHYIKQSQFEGSWRQLRAKTLKALLKEDLPKKKLAEETAIPLLWLEKILEQLINEGFITQNKNFYRIV